MYFCYILVVRGLQFVNVFIYINIYIVWTKFDPKRKDATIELYVSRFEEEISSLAYKVGYSNLTKGERDVVYSLKTTTL